MAEERECYLFTEFKVTDGGAVSSQWLHQWMSSVAMRSRHSCQPLASVVTSFNWDRMFSAMQYRFSVKSNATRG